MKITIFLISISVLLSGCYSESEALTIAVMGGDISTVKKLTEDRDLDINYQDKSGWSYLHYYNHDEVDIAKLLLERGCNVNLKDNSGDTPLNRAVSYGNTKTVKYLIEHGADVNSQNNNGYSPIIQAAIVAGNGNKDAECLKALLNNKAEPNLMNKQGKTALDYAFEYKSDEIIKLLKDHGALTADELKKKNTKP